MRRFAKSVKVSQPSTGSNPVLSAFLGFLLTISFLFIVLRYRTVVQNRSEICHGPQSLGTEKIEKLGTLLYRASESLSAIPQRQA